MWSFCIFKIIWNIFLVALNKRLNFVTFCEFIIDTSLNQILPNVTRHRHIEITFVSHLILSLSFLLIFYFFFLHLGFWVSINTVKFIWIALPGWPSFLILLHFWSLPKSLSISLSHIAFCNPQSVLFLFIIFSTSTRN